MLNEIDETVKGSKIGNSLKFNLLMDESRHKFLYISVKMITTKSGMSKIKLPKLR